MANPLQLEHQLRSTGISYLDCYQDIELFQVSWERASRLIAMILTGTTNLRMDEDHMPLFTTLALGNA